MKINNAAKCDKSNHITCYKRMSNYSLDCTNMLNCNGSCDNEYKEFFPNSDMRPVGTSTFMRSLKNGFELVKRYN